MFDQNINLNIGIKFIDMDNIDPNDNITEELSKLLRDSKEKKTDLENNNESDNNIILDTPTDIDDKDEDGKLNKDLTNAVSDLRLDTLKILEMLTDLNSEIDLLKERVNKVEHSIQRKKTDNIDEIQEQLDKVLAVKFDQIKQKINKNMKSSKK